MKTKHLTLLILSLLQFSFSFGQGQTTVAKFIITDASKNGIDMTPIALVNEAYIVFYTSDNDGLIYMANVWPNSDSQSFGPMYAFESEKLSETYETYEVDIFYFNWRYANTYDNKKGTAKVEVVKIYKPQGVAFIITIIPENLDIIVYKGYMEGTINFSNY